MGDAMRVEDQQYDAYSFLCFYLLNFMYIYDYILLIYDYKYIHYHSYILGIALEAASAH